MNRNILFIILVAFLSGSCKKYLDKKSDRNLVTELNVEQAQGLLDASHRMNQFIPNLGEASADDYFMNTARYNATSERAREAYLWGEEIVFEGTPNAWNDGYVPVYNSNLALEQLQKNSRNLQNEAAYDNVKGSALYFRSRCFLDNVLIWAKAYDRNTAYTDLGIPLRLSSDFTQKSVRATLQAVYDRVVEDLKLAAPLLPVTPQIVTRPSKPAAFALLSRTYLAMRDYENALKYADSCLRLKSTLLDYNQVNAALPYPFPLYNSEVIVHYNLFSPLDFDFGVDSNLYASYEANDLRKTLFFSRNNNNAYTFRGSYAGHPDKFVGMATDEMYLTRAECYARTGKVTEAMNDLNTLLVKRYKTGTFTPLTAANPQAALAKILLERRKQLLFRNVRWMDIKRLNKEGANITIRRFINNQLYELPPNDPRYALPLPRFIIDLTGMPQNPR
jgi:hypothetical protein